MKPLARSLFALAAAVVLLSPASAEDRRFSGRVVDARGKPVRNATVAAFWTMEKTRLEAKFALTTDREGRFDGTLPVPDERPVVLMALDKPQQRGGLVIVEPAKSTDLEIKASKLTSVRVVVDDEKLSGKPKNLGYELLAQPGQLNFLRAARPERTVVLKLPAGTYDLWISAEGAERHRERLVLNDKQLSLRLDRIQLRPSVIAENTGTTPPAWNITDARGVPKNVQLLDFKGKWVLLEFWGFW